MMDGLSLAVCIALELLYLLCHLVEDGKEEEGRMRKEERQINR